MVWIRQVIDQDVNLYRRAAARRDQPARSVRLRPAADAHAGRRCIATSCSNRRPVSVDGRSHRHVRVSRRRRARAQCRVRPRRDPDACRSRSRQREIEREIDELNRGVLVGAVVRRRCSPPASARRSPPRLRSGRAADAGHAADRGGPARRAARRRHGRRARPARRRLQQMTATLVAQRAELARTNQLKAWAEMARQVAHEIKNPLTPIQLAAEHLQRVHEDQGRPLGPVFDQCVTTILGQVRLLRQIASEFSNFAGEPTPRLEPVAIWPSSSRTSLGPYRLGPAGRIELRSTSRAGPCRRGPCDRTLIARALTNLIENAMQAMPAGGTSARRREAATATAVVVTVDDTGVGMDAEAARRARSSRTSRPRPAGPGSGSRTRSGTSSSAAARSRIDERARRGHDRDDHAAGRRLPARPQPRDRHLDERRQQIAVREDRRA